MGVLIWRYQSDPSEPGFDGGFCGADRDLCCGLSPVSSLARADRENASALAAVGALQFGLMYVLYLRAYIFLQASEVALFTIFTPLYLTLMDAVLRGQFERRHLAAALLSVAGAGVILWHSPSTPSLLTGFLLIQASNLCFAGGQLAYRRIRSNITAKSDAEIFGFLYLGAVLLTGITSLAMGSWSHFEPTAVQWITLFVLGTVASGLCFFWWNLGATRVNTGTLAAFNNAKIPLAVVCSLVFFEGRADLPRLLLSLALLTSAIFLAQRETRRSSGTRNSDAKSSIQNPEGRRF